MWTVRTQLDTTSLSTPGLLNIDRKVYRSITTLLKSHCHTFIFIWFLVQSSKADLIWMPDIFIDQVQNMYWCSIKSFKNIIWFTIEVQYELQLLVSLFLPGQSCSHPNLLYQASLSKSVQRQHHKVHYMIVYYPTQIICTWIFICCCVPW